MANCIVVNLFCHFFTSWCYFHVYFWVNEEFGFKKGKKKIVNSRQNMTGIYIKFSAHKSMVLGKVLNIGAFFILFFIIYLFIILPRCMSLLTWWALLWLIENNPFDAI